jgi:hypothetical protein
MALYKNAAYLQTSTSDAFDKTYSPGASTPHSGIYRCEGCTKEIAANQGNPLPPQNHHQHTSGQGTIRWRLIVYAQ